MLKTLMIAGVFLAGCDLPPSYDTMCECTIEDNVETCYCKEGTDIDYIYEEFDKVDSKIYDDGNEVTIIYDDGSVSEIFIDEV